MDARTTENTLEECSDKEIRDEYAERFGDPKDADLGDFSTSDLIDELESRDAMPTPDLGNIEEVADLIAEAARISHHAVRAYELIAEQVEELPTLRVRQALIAGRMAEVA